MSSVALAPTAASRPAINPWFVAAAVVVPTFMEVLDTTIANVALRYIAGGPVGVERRQRVGHHQLPGRQRHDLADHRLDLRPPGPPQLLPAVDRRLHHRLGALRRGHQPGQLILFRVIQGLAGGGLQPSSQAILLDSFPPEKQGAAQTMFGVAALLAPVVGPTLGGYLTVNYNWRWIFYINLPVGAVGFLASYFLVDDPDYLKKERAELTSPAAQFRLHRPGAARPDHVVLGSDAQQGAGVGLVRRPVLAGADAVHPFRRRAGRPDRPGTADCQPGGQLPAAGRAEFRGLLHHHLLCVRCPLWRQHVLAGPAPDSLRLRRLRLGAGAVAVGHFLHH